MGIDRKLPKITRKTCAGENKNMMNDGNQKAEASETDDTRNLSGMAKAFLVSVAWSYAEALERMKRSDNPQEPAPDSPTEQVEPDTEKN
ncbi:hypothetical protein QUA81_19215 [Microcoleus sp. F6_B4]